MTDPRLQAYLPIGRSGGVMLRGSSAAPINKRITVLKGLVDDYLRRHADLRASEHRLTNAELEERRRGNAAVLAKALEQEAQTVRTQRDEVRMKMLTVSAVRRGADSSWYDGMIDAELRQYVRSLEPNPKAQLVAQMMADPLVHLRTVEAVLRAPNELTGLRWQELRTIQVRLFAQLNPGEFRALDDEAAQLNAAQQALAITTQVLAESGASWAHEAPTAALLQTDPELATGLHWLPSDIDARYALGEPA
jgi:hypothetical protein